MSCQEYQKLVLADPEDELGRAEREELMRHLAECADCRKLAAELRLELQIFQAIGRAEPLPELPPWLPTRIAARAVENNPRRRPLRARLALALGAAALVIGLAGGYLLSWQSSSTGAADSLSLTSISFQGRGIGVEIGANSFVLHSRDKDGKKGIDLEF
ncbi:MAG TPA: zf-HC2 domain-containing protein [bacterium]|nr:zf-HC2 domain-containing protein [bacterium]